MFPYQLSDESTIVFFPRCLMPLQLDFPRMMEAAIASRRGWGVGGSVQNVHRPKQTRAAVEIGVGTLTTL